MKVPNPEVHHMMELTTKSEVYEYLDFLADSIEVLRPCEKYLRKEDFDTILNRVGTFGFAVWVQLYRKCPMAVCSVVMLTDIKGRKICYLWLLHAKPGADTKKAFEEVILPWAERHDANVMQASNVTYTEAKQRWFSQFKFEKTCEIQERKLK